MDEHNRLAECERIVAQALERLLTRHDGALARAEGVRTAQHVLDEYRSDDWPPTKVLRARVRLRRCSRRADQTQTPGRPDIPQGCLPAQDNMRGRR